jgi:hypothetical protein
MNLEESKKGGAQTTTCFLTRRSRVDDLDWLSRLQRLGWGQKNLPPPPSVDGESGLYSVTLGELGRIEHEDGPKMTLQQFRIHISLSRGAL